VTAAGHLRVPRLLFGYVIDPLGVQQDAERQSRLHRIADTIISPATWLAYDSRTPNNWCISYMEFCMRKQIALSALALGVVSAPVFADGFSYTNVDVSYVKGDISNFDGGEGILNADGDGFSLSGSAAFNDNVFGFAGISDQTLDDLDVDGVSAPPGLKMKVKLLSVGVGFHWPLGESVDFVSGLSFERLKASLTDGVDSIGGSDNGFGVSAGLRGRLGESLELTGTLKYMDVGGSEMVYSAGGRYYFTQNFAAGIDYTKYDDTKLSAWGIALRYDFGAR
jgi:hypothetical protein